MNFRDIRFVKRRGPVKNLNRKKKAKMINQALQAYSGKHIKNMRLLDIGSGNGGICAQFLEDNEVYGVDIEDVRKIKKGYTFKLVHSAVLPFKDSTFDIIISNHTIEHIPEQDTHLEEIKRVLKKDGVVYLATPNKSSPLMRGHIGNPDVLRWKEMKPLFAKHGFAIHEWAIELLKHPEIYGTEFPYVSWLPRPILQLLRPLFASHIFILEKKS